MTSVRERLEREPALLEVSSAESGGAVSAARKTSDGWVPGLAVLKVEGGDLVVSADVAGTVTVEELRLDLGPIEIPETVLGYPLALTDIHLSLIEPVKIVAEWSDDNTASGDAYVDLKLAWSLLNHGTEAPLGSPDLPPVPVTVEVTGNSERVHADVRVSAPGELWAWANVFRLEDLSLVIKGDTF